MSEEPRENPAAAYEAADEAPVLGGPSVTGGTLPPWFLRAVVGGSALIALAILLATGSFSIVLLFLITFALALPTAYIWSRRAEGGRAATDRLVTLGITAGFGIAVAPLISLLYEVVKRGVNRFDADFFTESARGVIGAGGGAQHAIVGTLVITGVATVISVPIGIMAAVYLNEYGSGRLRRALTFFVDVMTGIPSIVAGLFAYALFAIFLGPGIRLGVIGSVALSVLMIPIVIRSAEEILKIVPNHLREAAYALGTPKWRVIMNITLRAARAGVVTGVLLAVARIAGETAPLLFTALNNQFWTADMTQPMASLPVTIFKFAMSPYENWQKLAWGGVFLITIGVLVLNILARVFLRNRY